MINITFGEVVVNATNTVLDRLIISKDVINNIVYKTVFLVVKNSSIIIGDINDAKTLLIEDTLNELTIFNSSMTLQNIEINERESEIYYQYTFKENIETL